MDILAMASTQPQVDQQQQQLQHQHNPAHRLSNPSISNPHVAVPGSAAIGTTSPTTASTPTTVATTPTSTADTTARKRSISEAPVSKPRVEISQADFNTKLETVLNVLRGLDQHGALAGQAKRIIGGKEVSLSFQDVLDNARASFFTNIQTFKEHLTQLLNLTITTTSLATEKGRHASQLYALTIHLLNDQTNLVVSGKEPVKDENQTTIPTRDYEKVALFQRSPEGFVFSSASRRPIAPPSPSNTPGDKADSDVTQVKVIPFASLESPPLLRNINPVPWRPRSTMTSTNNPAKKPANAVEFYTAGAYSSFAPCLNSAGATLSTEATIEAYRLHEERKERSNAIKEKILEGKSLESTLANLNEILSTVTSNAMAIDNLPDDFLKDEGIDTGLLFKKSANGEQETEMAEEMEIESQPDIGGRALLENNAKLLLELQKLQEARFASHSPRVINAREQEIATTLQQALTGLIAQVPPSQLVSPESVEDAMRKIPCKDPAFVGTLPVAKPFSFPSNSGRNGIPLQANSYRMPIVGGEKRPPPPHVMPQVALSPITEMVAGYPPIYQLSQQMYTNSLLAQHQNQPTKTYKRPRMAGAEDVGQAKDYALLSLNKKNTGSGEVSGGKKAIQRTIAF